MNMNKREFIDTLTKKLNCSVDEANKINEIFEHNFFISKQSKNKIVSEIKESLNKTDEEADYIYQEAITILKDELKNSLKHPFRSK